MGDNLLQLPLKLMGQDVIGIVVFPKIKN